MEEEIKREDIKRSGPIYNFARIKLFQSRGSSYISIFLSLGIITANIGLFGAWFQKFGISMETLLLVGCIGYIVSTVTVGYIDDRLGIWRKENEYLTMSVNDYGKASIQWAEGSYKMIKKLDEQQTAKLIKEIHDVITSNIDDWK